MVVIIANKLAKEIYDAVSKNKYLVKNKNEIKNLNLPIDFDNVETFQKVFNISEVRTVIIDSSCVTNIEVFKEIDVKNKRLIFVNTDYKLYAMLENGIFNYIEYDKDKLDMDIFDASLKVIRERDVLKSLINLCLDKEIIALSYNVLNKRFVSKKLSEKNINVIDDYESKFELFVEILKNENNTIVIRVNEKVVHMLLDLQMDVKYYVLKDHKKITVPIFPIDTRKFKRQLKRTIKEL